MINGVQIDNIVFLTESFAKKKQTNKKTNTNKINKANLQEKKTNKQYLPVSDTTTLEISEEE